MKGSTQHRNSGTKSPSLLRNVSAWGQNRKQRSLEQQDRRLGLLLIAPALLLFTVIIVYPLANTLWLSLHERNLLQPQPQTTFIGLRNYVDLLLSADFRASAFRSTILTFGTLGLQIAIALPLAMLLDQKDLRGLRVARSFFIVPWAMPTFVAAFAWGWMLHPRFGVVNFLLEKMSIIGDAVPWLGQTATAMPIVILAYVWKGLPWVLLVVIAGLQTIAPEQKEAATVDGAGPWQVFRHIILPGLRYVLVIVVILRAIWTFNNFELVYLLTGGGPLNATQVLAVEVYKTGFVAFRMGLGAAIGSLMLATLTLFVIWYLRILRKQTEGL